VWQSLLFPPSEGEADGYGCENLIASDKQSGKAVYGAEDKKIGSIERVMIDKSSGEPAYAVLSIGRFLGMGDDHYPVPWKLLRYDSGLDGYRSDISGNRKELPSMALNSSIGRLAVQSSTTTITTK
jgi:hypothetical protein